MPKPQPIDSPNLSFALLAALQQNLLTLHFNNIYDGLHIQGSYIGKSKIGLTACSFGWWLMAGAGLF
jgi:hypothetical protein